MTQDTPQSNKMSGKLALSPILPVGGAALVTGAGRRIGRATALMLATSGAPVIIHYNRSQIAAESLVAEIIDCGGRAAALPANLADAGAAAALCNQASQAIGEARDKGDLSENAEYDAAKEAQGMLEMKISKMEETLANARIIDESQLDVSKVLVLSKVRIKNLTNNMEVNYTLVAESEADLKSGKISVSSPIGRGLLGKEVGDIAEVSVPNGKIQFEILSIDR